jgi:Cof subfamily protein (haloacid dehalogenase superfamily)
MTIRLLATDLDGTLINKNQLIPPRTRAVLRQVVEQGVYVAIATGRGYLPARQYWQELGLNAPIICYQGLRVYMPETGDIIYQRNFQESQIRRIIEVCHRHHIPANMYAADECVYTEAEDPRILALLAMEGTPYYQVSDLLAVKDIDPVKCILVIEAQQLAGIGPMLQPELEPEGIHLVPSYSTVIEAVPLDVSKGAALSFLAQYLGVSAAETMAIGDHDNDVEMIRWAGCGVAMASGSESIRQAADVIAPSVEIEGAATIFEELILNQ